MKTLIGKTLGQYLIASEIGRGGMAVVYKAEQPSLNRFVALKVLFPNFTGDPPSVARLRREAQAAAQLDHPNIVEIYEVSEDQDLHFIAMKYVDGQPLDQCMAAGPIPPTRIIKILAQVASALDYAHRHNVVHRDVKPSNILISAGDRVTLTDFGLAKATGSATLTSSGALVGTPAYMSPEQARGDEVDYRSDIYSLGVVAYEMLAGEPPFTGNPLSIILAHASQDPPPIREKRPELPQAVELVLGRVLAKEPADRYATASEFIAALRSALTQPQTQESAAPVRAPRHASASPEAPKAPRVAKPSPPRALWGIVGAIVVIGIVLGAGLVWNTARLRRTAGAEGANPSGPAVIPSVAVAGTWTPSPSGQAAAPTGTQSLALASAVPTITVMPTALPTASPTLSAGSSPTKAPTATMTDTPMPSPTSTDTPAPTETSPPAATPTRPALAVPHVSLLAPDDGAFFASEDTPQLLWQGSRPLAPGEQYVVVIDRVPPPPNAGVWHDYHITNDQRLIPPRYLLDTTADGRFVWYVQVMQSAHMQDGQLFGTVVGQPSSQRVFFWGPAPAGERPPSNHTPVPRPTVQTPIPTPTRDD